MSVFHVRKSLLIEAPLTLVYDLVRDFRQWPKWSPWLIAEPEAELIYAEDGSGYAWDGRITGSGKMEVVGGEGPRSLECRLTFLKPWKSVNKVGFTFTEKGDATEVVWSMEGSLPFFMFWMKGMMSGWIGSDYQRGLLMLKDLAETGTILSKLEFLPGQKVDGFRYTGVKSECSTEEISGRMQSDMRVLMNWLESSSTIPAGPPFAITHKWDPVKGRAVYTLAFPVKEMAAGLPAGFVSGEVPSCEAYVVCHTGAYRHLGNAWASGVMHGRAKVYAANRKIEPFEVYANDPTTTPEAELVTRVHFPTK